jgi:Family of unknown function (DUF6459)
MPPSELSALRLVRIPDAAPPFDCETHGAACPAARDLITADTRASGPGAADPVDVTRRAAAARAGEYRAGPAQPGTPSAMAGSAMAGTTAAWPRQFAQVMVEILAGMRPPRQIVPWTTDRVRAQIRHLGPLLVSDRPPRIQRIMTSRPAACVLEMTVIVSLGPRSRALALRLEHVAARPAVPGLQARPARWLCTQIEAG